MKDKHCCYCEDQGMIGAVSVTTFFEARGGSAMYEHYQFSDHCAPVSFFSHVHLTEEKCGMV